MFLRQYAGFHPANRYLLGRGPTGCDTTKPLLADENDPEVSLVRIEGWTSPTNQSPVAANGHESQWSLPPPTATALHARPEYALDTHPDHPDHPYAAYDGPKTADKLVFEPQLHSFEPHPTKVEQPHSIAPYESGPTAHFDPIQSPYDTAPPTRFDCPPPSASETVSKRETFSTPLSTAPMSSLLSSSTASTRNAMSHGVYSSDGRSTSFTLATQHESAAVPGTPYQSATSVPLSVYWNGDSYARPHAPSLSSVNQPPNSSGPGTTDHRHHFQGSYPYRTPAPLSSFTPVPAAQGQHPSFQPVDTGTENTFTA
jgi:hypothetical protein